MTRPTIVLGVTGSIASYKAADLTSRLTKRNFDVHVVMTQGALEFMTPLCFQTLSRNPVLTPRREGYEQWQPAHIALADRASLLLIAPATANIIAEIANGMANHPLTEIALATLAPVLIAPAMNGKMWQHPATQKNVETLRVRGVRFIGPEKGLLACGYEGMGRLWSVEGIVESAENILSGNDPTSPGTL